MRLKGIFRACVLVALCGASLTVEASAADLAPLYDAPAASYDAPEQPLTFGTGWYLRGDGAYAEEDRPKFDATLGSFSRDATSSGYAFGLGAGYKLDSYFRFDVTGDYLDRFDYQATASCGSFCSLVAKNSIWRWDGLANGYVDLGTWYGVTPYVGAGAGVAGTVQDAQQNVTTTSGFSAQTKSTRDTYQFAWAAMAGFSYAFSPHTMIDIGYRYLDLGRTKIELAPLAATSKDITEQQVRVGLRYMID